MAELVDGEGWISDESSFYGDESQKAQWEGLVESFDPVSYFGTSQFNINSLAASKASAASPRANKAAKLFDHFSGKTSGRQLSETVPQFLARLPPSTIQSTDIKDYIWIANPYIPPRETSADIAGFKAAAAKTLEHFERAKEATSQPQRRATKASPTKALAKDRKEAEEALLKIAKEYGVTSGKWMFFPLPEDVDRVWTIVAEGTARGELGSMAKVAADEGKGDRVGRLICVYTRDFSDQEDVKRVLLGLVDKGLVDYGRGARGIYYKCDAWTYVGIENGNEWGFKASMYSSNDMLKSR
ncbi:MAG: hypothetical protein LQ340_000469 [Diploschistes diacapsis]|nr:MAG: hypothetical protein LQ340_000469 [Diploschistes diacapsis]